jgi:hypothetical protein
LDKGTAFIEATHPFTLFTVNFLERRKYNSIGIGIVIGIL